MRAIACSCAKLVVSVYILGLSMIDFGLLAHLTIHVDLI